MHETSFGSVCKALEALMEYEAEAEGAGAALGARRRRVAPGGSEARPGASLHPIKKLVECTSQAFDAMQALVECTR